MNQDVEDSRFDRDEELKLLREARYAAEDENAARMIATADELLKRDPRCHEALFTAGIAFLRGGHDGLALQMFNVCAQLNPKEHAVWHNIGDCLHERHPEEAYKALAKANALAPDQAVTLAALCNVSSTLGRHAEAVDWAERCFKLHGHQRDAAHNASFALFALGRWAEAWKLFRGSIGGPGRVERNYTAGAETPRWHPKVKNGCVVFYGEQGLGDEILYASMLPLAIDICEAQGVRVVIECDERNAGLFRRAFPKATVYGTRAQSRCDWPAEEGVTHKMEFGGIGEHVAPEPFRRGAFLSPDPARAEMWLAWLRAAGRKGKPKVGIAWTGGSWETGRDRRSVPFKDIARILRAFRDEVDFVCLEYEDRREELEMAPADVLNPHWATRKGADYDEAAALVSALDLVIAPTTSIVDLAGGLGKECWALVDEHPQWRYSDFAGHDRMFFYESVKTIRQQDWGRWAPVIDITIEDLRAWLDARAAQSAESEAA